MLTAKAACPKFGGMHWRWLKCDGSFSPFLDDSDIRIIGVEAGGLGA
ncbi:MAG: hypothetical protein CM15mP55_2340 [Hyphomicrobiales bacterium]|nr:MAG: hypothetical protein CM15mP55_2340 [Hyphomicrobiales bacterium]